MTQQTRIVVLVGSVVAALLVVTVVVGVLILNSMNRQAEQDAYEDCMARHGYAADAPPRPGTDEDTYVSGLAEASAACMS